MLRRAFSLIKERPLGLSWLQATHASAGRQPKRHTRPAEGNQDARPAIPEGSPQRGTLAGLHMAGGRVTQTGGTYPLSHGFSAMSATSWPANTRGFACAASADGGDPKGVGAEGGVRGDADGSGTGSEVASSEEDAEPLRISLQEAIMRLADAAVGKARRRAGGYGIHRAPRA